MDEEGWFSVTPESIARHHASRCGDGIVIDCFTGVSGNAILFAMKSKHVIAIHIDPQKIDYARHNAAIYGVNDNIDFIMADFVQVANWLKYSLFEIAKAIAPKIVTFLPRSVDIKQLACAPEDKEHLYLQDRE